jgi:MFS superfamily sulfate permease-like transporter
VAIVPNSSWRWRRSVGVLGQGLLRGVIIGAIISLVLLIRRASRPHVALLGRIPARDVSRS